MTWLIDPNELTQWIENVLKQHQLDRPYCWRCGLENITSGSNVNQEMERKLRIGRLSVAIRRFQNPAARRDVDLLLSSADCANAIDYGRGAFPSAYPSPASPQRPA